MFTLSLIAAGLVAVAAVLTTRPAPAVRTADERGITLQTLIVTAVLVLMAVAAGVVIVAITRSASDDLSNQTTDIPGNCNEVEVYDPQLAAANAKGTNIEGEKEGSDIGCVPVCTLTFPTAGADFTALTGNPPDFSKIKLGVDRNVKESSLAVLTGADQFDLATDQTTLAAGLGMAEMLLAGKKFLFKTGTDIYFSETDGASPTPTITLEEGDATKLLGVFEIARVAVAPNQDQCHAYDVTGDVATIFG